jgi:para-aminobenzoate synthetase component I
MTPLSDLASNGDAFFFITDFEGRNLELYTLDELEQENIKFSFKHSHETKHQHKLTISPPSYENYKKGFNCVIEAIKRGETYVLNYTCKTEIKTSLSLNQIYEDAHAKFKLFYKDQFVCFSPEPFIEIRDNTIHTYPMKGTIDSSIKNAKEIILANDKELAEHTMIVDLLRNDLSQVATDVKVNEFRYVESIKAGDSELLQVSSHIQGTLATNWKDNLDDIIQKLLPAGSISGAPKISTVKHIKKIENYERGYFSGVMGYFDGETLSTAIMIRFIEKTGDTLFYKSGGGITIDSDARKEYEEMLAKIYIP